MSSNLKKSNKTTLYLTVVEDCVPVFFPLLAKGFDVKTKIGCSVQELLCRHLGLSEDYLEQRLQTIFLDGKAVDDVKTAVVLQNSTLALSAAMPGLAGITMRRGGVYASMRHQITHKRNTTDEVIKNGTVVLKLFNLVARDIGSRFLTQGIWITGENLQNFFRKAPGHFWDGCLYAEIEGVEQEVNTLAHVDWKRQQVYFKLSVK
jgi:hypothetical protein